MRTSSIARLREMRFTAMWCSTAASKDSRTGPAGRIVESLFVQHEQSQAELQALKRGEQTAREQLRGQLRTEILAATRAGWQFILAGLLLSTLGIVLAALA